MALAARVRSSAIRCPRVPSGSVRPASLPGAPVAAAAPLQGGTPCGSAAGARLGGSAHTAATPGGTDPFA